MPAPPERRTALTLRGQAKSSGDTALADGDNAGSRSLIDDSSTSVAQHSFRLRCISGTAAANVATRALSGGTIGLSRLPTGHAVAVFCVEGPSNWGHFRNGVVAEAGFRPRSRFE